MSFWETTLLSLFAATSVTSIAGFQLAKSVHRSNGPSRAVARFSVWMGCSFGLYLAASAGLTALNLARGSDGLAAAFLAAFAFPFAVAGWARSYARAEAAFNLQIAALAAALLCLPCLDERLLHALHRLG